MNVFISFCSSLSYDQSIATKFHAGLTAVGVDSYLPSVSLTAGQHTTLHVNAAIRSSDYVIALISNDSLSQSGSHFREQRQALELVEHRPEGSIFIIPVLIDDPAGVDQFRQASPLKGLYHVELFPNPVKAAAKIFLSMGHTLPSNFRLPAPR